MLQKPLIRIIFLFVFSTSTYVTFAQCSGAASFKFSFNNDCDSTRIEIENISTASLPNVAYFEWDFGDGQVITGDSNTNTVFWDGINSDGKFGHTYHKTGSFGLRFIVQTKTGCKDTMYEDYVARNIHTNDFKIEHNYTSRNEVCFSVKDIKTISPSFLWNFGDPPKGNMNHNDRSYDPCVVYGTGAYMISLRVVTGKCDFSIYDTVIIQGPQATIEVPFDRIKHTERYQCVSVDTVHFTNHSSFYRNDNNPGDEDSTVIINGKPQLVFNYIHSNRSGDQTALSSDKHYANRTMGNQVKRLWNFGDEYAQGCTTNTAKNQNVGQNCNYSEDEFPTHFYQNWDSIYFKDYYNKNVPFCHFTYDDQNKKYIEISVDTSESVFHRYIFFKTIPHSFIATLSLKDAVSGHEASDSVVIVNTRPDASKLRLVSGHPCPLGSGNQFYLTFDMNTGGQSYFAVNFDSLNNTGFYAFNSGAVLAPPTPGSPLPFIYPYDLIGDVGTQFVKGYSSTEVGSPSFRKREGSLTMGLVVGNGPLGTGGSAPSCTDTVWHHDIVRIRPLNTDFEIVQPNRKSPHYCMDEDFMYVKLDKPEQVGISQLWWNIGIYGKNENYYAYRERYNYLQPYNGPSASRNDSTISYNGEDWLYNFIERFRVTNYGDIVIIDTIVTSIIKDWKSVISQNTADYLQSKLRDTVTCFNALSDLDLIRLSGNLIDTSSIAKEMEYSKEEYRKSNGDNTYITNGKRYRYINAAKSDSVEVAHILHFRDLSIQGFDTLIVGNDTTFGVWKLPLTFTTKDSFGNTRTEHGSGVGYLSMTLTNMDGCQRGENKQFTTGLVNRFIANSDIDSTVICTGNVLELHDSIRYWQYETNKYPQDFPIDPRDFWSDNSRFAQGLETFKVDWDKSDGKWDWKIAKTHTHQYSTPGRHIISIAIKDSMNCLDTAEYIVHVPNIGANYTYSNNSSACTYKVQFFDSIDSYNGTKVVSRLWDFGDGNQVRDVQYPIHEYATFGDYDVKLKVWLSSDCTDSTTKSISISNGNTKKDPTFEYSVNDLTLNTFNPSYVNDIHVWHWDDNSDDDTTFDASHTYAQAGNVDVCLTAIDTGTNCTTTNCKTIGIGDCNAKFGYAKDTTKTFQIIVHDSSSGANLSYIWYWGDGDSSTTKQPSHDYTTFGKFQVTLQVSNTNCISIYSDSLGLDSLGKLLKADGFTVKVGGTNSISELSRQNAQVYPNPSTGQLNIKVTKGIIDKVAIYSIDGKRIQPIIVSKEANLWSLHVDVAPGVYSIVVNTDIGWDVKTFEIQE